VIGGKVAVRDPEIPLQLNGIASSLRHQGLQPDGGGQRDMGGGDLAERAPDFSEPLPADGSVTFPEVVEKYPRAQKRLPQ
jgi:hypothetical protein